MTSSFSVRIGKSGRGSTSKQSRSHEPCSVVRVRSRMRSRGVKACGLEVERDARCGPQIGHQLCHLVGRGN